ncbi:type VI secretion system protein TssA [Pseudorhodoferax sp. Leaf267]|uniref:type VI secretion system protein TssA n=1 Tax=Pseudorhodoferax sp. Leaf267 TaxID=1736316 RepID=UPI0006FE09D1|nr:type VI secretion system protein TssA [Pseudorhodoferax sp. Leaf267]KQP12620.1 hypothetical protein ASF43_20480 [Pseudorhodoferax sp. Leaf267]
MHTDHDLLFRLFDGDHPCGPDMSFSVEFDTLRELRREDDPSLNQGEWVTELKRADWPGVLAACETLLRERSKDLRVAGWYTEAATRLRGYAGLADGLALYAGLVRVAWDGVHPQLDEDDHELRIGSIVWLLSLVQQMSDRVPVLHDGVLRFSLADLEMIRQRLPSGDETAQGQSTPQELQRVQRKTPTASVAAVLADARRASLALEQLQAEVDARLGMDGPGFVAAREALADAVRALERLLRDMGGSSAVPAAEASTPAAGAQPTVTTHGAALGDRAQALAQLREVAEFFRRTEPHSPVAYLAERAASWGEMPLHIWLRTVMQSNATLAQLEELLGVAPASADAGH